MRTTKKRPNVTGVALQSVLGAWTANQSSLTLRKSTPRERSFL
jgi:hypothetical protein